MQIAMQVISSFAPAFLAIGFVVFGYFINTIDRTRANSPSKDDTQVGIKLVIWAFILAGVAMAVMGLGQFLDYALGGFKGGSMRFRIVLGPLLVGAGTAVVGMFLLLPKTNNAQNRQIERYAL